MDNLFIVLLFCFCVSLNASPTEWFGDWIYNTPRSCHPKFTTQFKVIIGGTAITIALGTLWYFRDNIPQRNKQLEDKEDEC